MRSCGPFTDVKQEPELGRRINVLIVDDSAFMRSALSRMINSDASLRVVATAADGVEALQLIRQWDPDVVTLDVEMPQLDGLATLRCIMRDHPRPVIMVSSATWRGAETTLAALGAGAFDYVSKQLSCESLDIDHIRADLIAKIKAAAASKLYRRSSAKHLHAREAERDPSGTAPLIVAIGTSTGGPKALEEILPVLPADIPVPILVIS